MKHIPRRSESLKNSGFTIVEIIIVILVIGILATILIVAYGSATSQTKQKTLQSDLKQAASAIDSQKNFSDSSWTLSGFPSSATASGGNYLQLTNYASDPSKYCINGFRTDPATVYSYRSGQTDIWQGLCPGQQVGSALGGTLPSMPRGVNLVQPLSDWSLSSGTMTYDSTNNQLVQTPGTTGTYISPLIRVDSPKTITMTLTVSATQPSVTYTPQSGVNTGMQYFAADGVTPVKNALGGGYTSNGNAPAIPLNTSTSYSYSYTGGPNVIYVRATINASTYTSDDIIKNIQITISD